MKRRLLKLSLLLLAGAIINVAVAWACVIWSPKLKAEFIPNELDDIFWRDTLKSMDVQDDGYVMLFHVEGFGVTNRATTCILPRPHSTHIDFGCDSRLRAGLPFCGLRGRLIVTRDHMTLQYTGRGAIPWPHADFDRWRPATGLPLLPVWPGFAINTLFYAAIMWLFFFAPFQLRRWRRIRRNLCPACAYPVGTSDNCTECGKPVKPR